MDINEFKPKTNPIGKRYGRLLVTSFSHKKGRTYYYNCLCDCGNQLVKTAAYLFNPNKNPHQSCGCWHKEINIQNASSHKLSKTPTYKSWCEMKARCYNKNNASYFRYGGRGIKVCDRWLNSFENFYADMGEKPEKMSLDRIDNNGNYSPENCRWADVKTQCNNRRSNLLFTYKGETKTLKQWCEEYNMKYPNVQSAYYAGYTNIEVLISIYKNNGRRGHINRVVEYKGERKSLYDLCKSFNMRYDMVYKCLKENKDLDYIIQKYKNTGFK